MCCTERGACAHRSVCSPYFGLGKRTTCSPGCGMRQSPLALFASGNGCNANNRLVPRAALVARLPTPALAATIRACPRVHPRSPHLTWRSSGPPPASAYLCVRPQNAAHPLSSTVDCAIMCSSTRQFPCLCIRAQLRECLCAHPVQKRALGCVATASSSLADLR